MALAYPVFARAVSPHDISAGLVASELAPVARTIAPLRGGLNLVADVLLLGGDGGWCARLRDYSDGLTRGRPWLECYGHPTPRQAGRDLLRQLATRAESLLQIVPSLAHEQRTAVHAHCDALASAYEALGGCWWEVR